MQRKLTSSVGAVRATRPGRLQRLLPTWLAIQYRPVQRRRPATPPSSDRRHHRKSGPAVEHHREIAGSFREQSLGRRSDQHLAEFLFELSEMIVEQMWRAGGVREDAGDHIVNRSLEHLAAAHPY